MEGRGLVCRVCGGDTTVIDSRPQTDYVRRRRKCLTCDRRFSTVERRPGEIVERTAERLAESIGEKLGPAIAEMLLDGGLVRRLLADDPASV